MDQELQYKLDEIESAIHELTLNIQAIFKFYNPNVGIASDAEACAIVEKGQNWHKSHFINRDSRVKVPSMEDEADPFAWLDE